MPATIDIQPETPFHQIQGVPLTLNYQRVSDLLVTAFEGGSNYWFWIDGYVRPDDDEEQGLIKALGVGPSYSYFPLSRTGGVLISENEDFESGETWMLDEEAVRRGIDLLFQSYPKAAHDVISEDFDADTADLFLQLALFGEPIFS